MLKSVLIFFIGFACGAGVISISVNAQETKINNLTIFQKRIIELEKPIDITTDQFRLLKVKHENVKKLLYELSK